MCGVEGERVSKSVLEALKAVEAKFAAMTPEEIAKYLDEAAPPSELAKFLAENHYAKLEQAIMTDDKKPASEGREFWVLPAWRTERNPEDNGACFDSHQAGLTHVIEISALRKVEAERDELQSYIEANEPLDQATNKQLRARIAELETEAKHYRTGAEEHLALLRQDLTAALAEVERLKDIMSRDTLSSAWSQADRLTKERDAAVKRADICETAMNNAHEQLKQCGDVWLERDRYKAERLLNK